MRLVSVGDAELEVDVLGSGEPVSLIQTALTADELLPVAKQSVLRDSYELIWYHRRGYGRSSPTEGPGSIPKDAADSRELMAALEIERAHIVGVSYSAAIALQLALSDPERVRTLTVIEPPPVQIPQAEEFKDASLELIALYQNHGASVALDNFLTRLIGRNWRSRMDEHLPGAVQQMQRDAATFFSSDLPALLSWSFDALDARSIRQPALYIGGTDSGPWFAAVRALMLEWLSPEEVTVEGADHNLAVTHPEQVAHAISEFIARHPIVH